MLLLAKTRIVALALLVTLSGCATTGPEAPQTTGESLSGAAGGVVGAAAGGTLGAVGGAVIGIRCGIGFIICSPIFAAVYGVRGIARGGELGAKEGVKLARKASAPANAPKSLEPSDIPAYARETYL